MNEKASIWLPGRFEKPDQPVADGLPAIVNVAPRIPSVPQSPQYHVRLDGRDCPVYRSPCHRLDYVSFDLAGGPLAIEVEARDPAYWQGGATVRPQSRGVATSITDRTISFNIHRCGQYLLERTGITGNDQDAELLLIYVNPPEVDAPAPEDPEVIFYGPGVHEVVGDIELTSGQTLYLAAGALVRASGIRAYQATGIAVRGRGVLELSVDYRFDTSVLFERCRGVLVEGVAMFSYAPRPRGEYGFENLLLNCDEVVFRNYKSVGSTINSDGIHSKGSRLVTIEDCFILGTDDCVPIYSDAYGKIIQCEAYRRGILGASNGERHRGEVGGFLVQRCVFWPGWQSGVCRIGWGDYPLATSARGIVFRDCDVIHMHKGGHNERALLDMREFADRPSLIQDVIFEDIRIEEVDAILTVYQDESKSARLRNILLKDIALSEAPRRTSFLGRAGSSIFGSNDFQGIRLQNVTVCGVPMRSPAQLGLACYGAAAMDHDGLQVLDATGADRCPVVRLAASTTSGPAPLHVSFDASASSSPDGQDLEFAWDFGDGSTGSGSKPHHVYREPGSYATTLVVTDGRGTIARTRLAWITVAATGLRGEYFLRGDLSRRMVVTVDPDLKRAWGLAPAHLEIGRSGYSMRWQGRLLPRGSGRHCLALIATGGVRLWLDGQLLIDRWLQPGGGVGEADLDHRRGHELRVDYTDLGWPGSIELRWSGPTLPDEAIPSTCFRPWTDNETTAPSATSGALPTLLELFDRPPMPGTIQPVEFSWLGMKQAGYEFIPNQDLGVLALGRAVGGTWTHAHTIRLWRVDDRCELARLPVLISSPMDEHGVRHERLLAPIRLSQGVAYRITSTEYPNESQNLIGVDLSRHRPCVRIVRGVHSRTYDGFPEELAPVAESGSGLPTFYAGG